MGLPPLIAAVAKYGVQVGSINDGVLLTDIGSPFVHVSEPWKIPVSHYASNLMHAERSALWRSLNEHPKNLNDEVLLRWNVLYQSCGFTHRPETEAVRGNDDFALLAC